MEKIGVCHICAARIVAQSELEGTTKQIVWAERIQNETKQLIIDYADIFMVNNLAQSDIESVVNNDSAEFWIRNFRYTSEERICRFIFNEVLLKKIKNYAHDVENRKKYRSLFPQDSKSR